MELLRDWFKRSFSDPQVVILGLFLLVFFAIVIGLGKWLAPVFAAIVIAYLLEAGVSRLQRLGARPGALPVGEPLRADAAAGARPVGLRDGAPERHAAGGRGAAQRGAGRTARCARV